MHILLVEDDPDIRAAVGHNLGDAGYSVVAVGTGEEALQATSAELPDIVLLDLMLPDLNGGEVCRALRASPRTRDLPVIMVTARRGEDERIIGLEQGADDYVEKPFSMRELILRIEAVLKRARRSGTPHVDAQRAAAREQIRVWEGFSANHYQRGEWQECSEISRTILARHTDELTPAETGLLRDRIRLCELRLLRNGAH
jgi:two-component system, OmpR family, phosphate regulon response regulator PhoB